MCSSPRFETPGTSHAMSGMNFGLSQHIPSPFEAQMRKKVAYQKYLTSEEAARELANLIALQVRQTYADLAFQIRRRELTVKNRETLRQILRASESQVASGTMKASRLLKIRARIARQRAREAEISGLIAKQKEALINLCGTDLKWEEWLRDMTSLLPPTAQEEKPFKVEDHPLFRKSQSLLTASRHRKSLATAKVLPGVTVGMEYRLRQGVSGKDAGEDFISLKASVPLPLYYPLKEQHRIKSAEADTARAEDELQRVRRLLVTSWQGETLREKQLLLALKEYRTILTMDMSVYKNQIAMLPAGKSDLTEVLNAYGTYLKSSLEEARLRRDLDMTRARLRYLTYSYEKKTKKE